MGETEVPARRDSVLVGAQEDEVPGGIFLFGLDEFTDLLRRILGAGVL